tara:strand:+ start:390 stop:647 length:258 start_codon:yes stop_codon:yes gene_type:complete
LRTDAREAHFERHIEAHNFQTCNSLACNYLARNFLAVDKAVLLSGSEKKGSERIAGPVVLGTPYCPALSGHPGRTDLVDGVYLNA